MAPEIEEYITYVTETESSSDSSDTAKLIQELLFKYTQHTGTFLKCTFSGVAADVTWKDDVKCMIPFLVLTWLRQL